MSTARWITADVFDGLAQLDDNSVDLVLTSPPFLALRSYLPADHPDKAHEIGSEATPAAFLDTLLDVTEALDRVLAPHGSVVFELGDTYAGSGGGGGDYNADGLRAGQPVFDGSGKRVRETRRESYITNDVQPPSRRMLTDGWPDPKSLCGTPTLFAWSLAYGRNLLRPERETSRWRIRNLMPWCRPNPPVGALGDKFRPATSYFVVATKAKDRYFDLDAVRDNTPRVERDRNRQGEPAMHRDGSWSSFPNREMQGGAPPLDWIIQSTHPYPGVHYATWPPALLGLFIDSMCPRQACRECGEPSRRITAPTAAYAKHLGSSFYGERDEKDRREFEGTHGYDHARVNEPRDKDGLTTRSHETLGWTDCEHDNWRPGRVLDPFAGSGTTLAVATGMGRDAIGIDLNPANLDLARERCGMFLTDDHPEPGPRVERVDTGGRT